MENAAKILITGATGNVGSELTQLLSSQKVPFRAMVRSLGTAMELENLPYCELIEGNFDNLLSVTNALSNIEKVFLLTNSSEQAEAQQSNFVKAAEAARVKHIVKLSQWAADINSPVRFLRYHAAIERQIEDCGIAFTFLRPNLFMQGLLGFRETIIQKNEFYGAIGEAKISTVDVRDIAKAAAAALLKRGHQGKTYNLTGPEALSHYEMADMLSTALDRKIRFVDISPETLQQILLSVGFPVWQAEGLVEDYAHYKKGEASTVEPGIFEATGSGAISFSDFAKDYSSQFS